MGLSHGTSAVQQLKSDFDWAAARAILVDGYLSHATASQGGQLSEIQVCGKQRSQLSCGSAYDRLLNSVLLCGGNRRSESQEERSAAAHPGLWPRQTGCPQSRTRFNLFGDNGIMDDGRHRLLWELGNTSSGRCYWSLLDADFKIRYVDPTYALHMAQQADLAIGSSLFDFIHPQELQAAKRDYLAFLEGRTLFGTVTRCRFMRMSAMRKKFGAPADIPPQPPLERPDADDEYMPCKIVSSWIGDGTILCFFHAIVDRDPVADSNEELPSAWTNWCGPRTGNPTELYLTPSEQARISEVMTESEREAHEKPGGRPDLATATGDPAATPRYVFQILSGSDAQLILSHPPPNVVQYGEERDRTYDPYEYARLAREVWEKPREKNTDANTSCTRRFRSKHPIMRDGNLTTIDSVVIRYSSLCFACFQTRDTFSNRERGPFVNYPMGVSAAPMPTFRGEDRLSAPFPLATYGKRRRDDEEEEVPGHKPAPLMLQNAAGGPVRPFYEADSFNDAISPTVASGAAILGSFQNYRPPLPHEPPYHYNQSGTAVSSSFPQNTYDVYTSGYDYLGPNSNGGTPNGSTNGSNGLPPLQMPPFMSYHSPQYNEYGHMSPYQPHPPPAAAPSVSRHPVSPQSGTQPSPDLLNMGPPPSPAVPASPASSTTPRGVPKSSKASTAGQVTPHPGGRACASCGTTNSPEWRKGPNGVKSLCNACGLRFARSQAWQAKKLAQEQATAEGRPLPVEPPKKKGKKGKSAVASNAASTSASVDHAIPAQGQGTAALLPEDHPNLNESYGFASSYGGVYDPALGLSANSSNENW